MGDLIEISMTAGFYLSFEIRISSRSWSSCDASARSECAWCISPSWLMPFSSPAQRIDSSVRSKNRSEPERLCSSLCTSLRFLLDLMIASDERADSRKAVLMGAGIC